MNGYKATLFLALLALAPLAGCFTSAPTVYTPQQRITAFVDPAYRGARFGYVAVSVDTANLSWRRTLEKTMSDMLRRRGAHVDEGYTWFPPTRQWTPMQRRETLLGAGVDAVLSLQIDTIYVVERFAPPSTTTEVKRDRQKEPIGKDSVESVTEKETTTTRTEGGYTDRSYRTRYRIVLTDLKSGNVAWLAEHALAMNGDVGHFSDAIVEQLLHDGMVVWAGR